MRETRRTRKSNAAIRITLHGAGRKTRVTESRKTVRLLTVGNSFSQDATFYLEKIAAADGHRLIHHPCFIGGGSMSQHWDKITIHQSDPHSEAGLYYHGKSLLEELGAEPWDYVTIQQASFLCTDPKTYRPYAAQLQAFIETHAPQAELLMHKTWAYRRDDPWFSGKHSPPPPAKSQKAMYQALSKAYAAVARELGVRLIPVGDALYAVDNDPEWGYRPDPCFNPKTARPKCLPDQSHSLHVGYYWEKGPDKVWSLKMDGHHASIAGRYLGACVFYETLFGRSPVGNTYHPKGLSRKDARFLQEAAHRAVHHQTRQAISPQD